MRSLGVRLLAALAGCALGGATCRDVRGPREAENSFVAVDPFAPLVPFLRLD